MYVCMYVCVYVYVYIYIFTSVIIQHFRVSVATATFPLH